MEKWYADGGGGQPCSQSNKTYLMQIPYAIYPRDYCSVMLVVATILQLDTPMT
jgi:hypothetical protein